MTKPLTFTMYRRNVPDTTHNANQKNPPEQPQFEGVLFSDKTVAIRWCTLMRSTSVWNSLEDMLAIHGHPEYDSELVYHDDRLDKNKWLDVNKHPPKPGVYVLTYQLGKQTVACYSTISSQWISTERVIISNPTHWQELPEDPVYDA